MHQPQSQLHPQLQPQLPRKHWGSFLINTILLLFLFLPSKIMSKYVLETHNPYDFTLGYPVWYLEPPTLPTGPSKTPTVSRPAPLPPTEIGGKATKTIDNTIYMIVSTIFHSVSSAMEDPPDLSQHHLHNDGEICKTTLGFTPFLLNHSVELVLPVKY